MHLMKDLESPGLLGDNVSYDFKFNKADMKIDSYNGI
jgi:hypothetical protein